MIYLNGKEIRDNNFKTLQELVNSKNLKTENVVILVNDEIVKKEQWQNYKLKDNDNIEIIGFVGGG